MMNFPASPTEGQEFVGARTYIWNGYAWILKPAAGGGGGGASIEVSDTPPVSPQANGLWWESDTGGLFLYYDDGNTQQFVQLNGSRDAFSPVRLNPSTISQNASVPSGYNGVSAGPVTIADGVTVDVANGSTWTVV